MSISCVATNEERHLLNLEKAQDYYKEHLYTRCNESSKDKIIAVGAHLGAISYKIYETLEEAWDLIPLHFDQELEVYVDKIGDEFFLTSSLTILENY